MYVKENVNSNEYRLHKKAYDNGINVPKIIEYDKDKKVMKMEKVDSMNIADMYGDNFDNLPENIVIDIREILDSLYSINIEYVDITGYNFIEYKGKVWIIDFGHSKGIFKRDRNKFVNNFINGIENRWNPEFK